MKTFCIGMIFVWLLVFPAMGLAEGMYGSVGVGVAWMSDSDVHVNGFYAGTAEFDTGYSVGAAVGIMRETFRLDGELSYMASDMDTFDGFPSDAEIDALTFLANGYYDFNTGGPMKPYITAGIGASRIEISEPGYSDEDDTVFTYQVGFGVGYELSEALILDCRYRFMSGQDMEFSDSGNNIEVEIASHIITVGIRMPF